MAKKGDAEFLQVFGGELRKDFGIDRMLRKRALILRQSKLIEPIGDIHPRLIHARR